MGIPLSLHLVQVLHLGLEVGGQGLQVPGVLHDALHCNTPLHISLKNAVQQASALSRKLQTTQACSNNKYCRCTITYLWHVLCRQANKPSLAATASEENCENNT